MVFILFENQVGNEQHILLLYECRRKCSNGIFMQSDLKCEFRCGCVHFICMFNWFDLRRNKRHIDDKIYGLKLSDRENFEMCHEKWAHQNILKEP